MNLSELSKEFNKPYTEDYLAATISIQKKQFRNKEELRRCNTFRGRQREAKTKGIEFSIKLNELEYPKVCPLLGIEIHYHSSNHKDHYPSIDRIDNTKGYITGNVWVISNRANRLKSDSTVGELMMLALNLRKKIKSNM